MVTVVTADRRRQAATALVLALGITALIGAADMRAEAVLDMAPPAPPGEPVVGDLSGSADVGPPGAPQTDKRADRMQSTPPLAAPVRPAPFTSGTGADAPFSGMTNHQGLPGVPDRVAPDRGVIDVPRGVQVTVPPPPDIPAYAMPDPPGAGLNRAPTILRGTP